LLHSVHANEGRRPSGQDAGERNAGSRGGGPARLDVAAALRGKRVFVTGATGFLGGVLVETLLRSLPEIGRLLLLIRPAGRRGAEDRLRDEVLAAPPFERLRTLHLDDWNEWAADKVAVVAGDLGRDHFGLDAADYAALCTEVDLVVSCAATVTFDERLDRAVETNARGAARTLSLARDAAAAQGGPSVPLLHVSTCFVSGGREGPVAEHVVPPLRGPDGAREPAAVLAEMDATCRSLRDAEPEALRSLVEAGSAVARRYGYHDVYTLTKALGELLIDRHRGEVPVTILRPAIVTSAAGGPLPGWIDGVRVVDPLLVAYGRGRMSRIPGSADAVLDLVPVDFVVHAMVAALAELAQSTDAACRVYQVSSSRNPICLGELMSHAREGFDRTPLRDDGGAPIRLAAVRFTDPERYQRRLLARLRRLRWLGRGRRGSAAQLRSGRTVDHLLHLLAVYRPYLDHRARYDDSATRRLWQRLSAGDQERLPFDVAAIDWHSYVAATHVPGLVRFALHADSGAPPAAWIELRPPPGRGGGEFPSARASTLFGLLSAAAGLDPHAVAFQVCRQGRWLRYTYAQALTATANVAHRLAAHHGVGRGDRVVLWGAGSPEWVLTAFAVWRLGAVTVPLDPQWPADEVDAAARLTGARLICAAPQLHDKLAAASVAVVPLAAPWVPGPDVGLLPAAETLAERSGGGPAGGDLASIHFTSGTTVAPKAVPLSDDNFLANVRALSGLMGSGRERLLSVLPIHHVFELTMGLLVPLDTASTVSYVSEVKPAEIQWMMSTTRPTLLVAVPRLLALLDGGIRRSVAASPVLGVLFRLLFALSALSGERWGRALFAGVQRRFGGELRRIVSGGSALDPDLGRRFHRMGFRVSEGYGMTETSPVLTVNPWDGIRFGTVGRPLPGVEVELRPVEGAEAGSGEIWVRGPNVMAGYYRDPEASAEVLRDGWLCTGDVGRFDDDGYLVLCGRTKTVIVTAAGKNVYPEEVEHRYRDLPGVEELVVVGLPAEGGGERVCAVVVPAAQAEADGGTSAFLDRLRAALDERSAGVPSYQRIADVLPWSGDLPKTSTMKVKRGVLRDAVLAGRRGAATASQRTVPPAEDAGGPRRDESRNGDERWILQTVARLTHGRPDQVEPERRLAELGLDSLSTAELVGELEARLGRRIDDDTVASLHRVEDLLQLVVDAGCSPAASCARRTPASP